MITPIRALTIEQICERKDDLLVSSDDIKKVAKYSKEQAIDEFAERLCIKVGDDSLQVMLPDGFRADVVTLDYVMEIIMEIAKQMKGGAEWVEAEKS